MTAIGQPAVSYQATLRGRRIRETTVSAANRKIFHKRPGRLRHDVEDVFAHLAGGVYLGLAGTSTVAVLLYTLTNWQAVAGPERAWEWQYRGRYPSGTESGWLSEEEVRDIVTSLHFDVFHDLWETYSGWDCRPLQASTLSKGEMDRELHVNGLQDFRWVHRWDGRSRALTE